jgi:hypothetical protein
MRPKSCEPSAKEKLIKNYEQNNNSTFQVSFFHQQA